VRNLCIDYVKSIDFAAKQRIDPIKSIDFATRVYVLFTNERFIIKIPDKRGNTCNFPSTYRVKTTSVRIWVILASMPTIAALIWPYFLTNSNIFMRISSIPQLFKAVELVIFHLTENKDLQESMSGYGLMPKRVQAGAALLKNARQMDDTQESHYDTARAMSEQIIKDREATLDVFKGHAGIAKLAFRKEPGMLKELKIVRIAKTNGAWEQQAIKFYNKASKYMDKLQQFGATPESFEQNKAGIKALIKLESRRLKKKGDAEDSTEQKNEAIKELREWYGEFRRLARMAFKKNPQVLETFGMVVLSAKRKKKAEAPQEDTAEAK
jgi:hypothetical protein